MTLSERAETMSAPQLLELFVRIGLAQYDAASAINTSRFSRLYAQMNVVRDELKRRQGDQRMVLRPLLMHPNVQVRKMAASTLLALLPDEARKSLESVRDSGVDPQCWEATSTLRALDEGFFIPK